MQKKLYPNLVHDAQLIIKELENVTVLWEELWLGTLQDLHPGETFFFFFFPFSSLPFCYFKLILGCGHISLYQIKYM